MNEQITKGADAIAKLADSGGPWFAITVVLIVFLVACVATGFYFLRGKLKDAEKKVDDSISSEREWLNAQLKKQSKRIDDLSRKLEEQERENDHLTEQVNSLQSQVTILQRTNTELLQENRELARRLGE